MYIKVGAGEGGSRSDNTRGLGRGVVVVMILNEYTLFFPHKIPTYKKEKKKYIKKFDTKYLKLP